MASKTTPTEVRQITRADVDAHRIALRRIESEAHHCAEVACNGEPRHFWSTMHARRFDLWSDEDGAEYDRLTMDKIARVLGYRPLGLFINGDPRGYALKVQSENAGDLHQDFGGYGLLAPDKES